jgi:hypothetical protein
MRAMKTFARYSVGIVLAAMLALCAGAVWAVVILLTNNLSSWMAVIAGAVAGLASVLGPWRTPIARALFAGVLTLLSIGYAHYLAAAVMVAGSLSYDLKATLFALGPEMAYAITAARVTLASLYLFGCGVALAIYIAVRQARAATRRPS